MPAPLVALVGLPNAGKSTLFNRLARKSLATVDATPGVTRDRRVALAQWDEHRFLVADTGGLTFAAEDDLARQIQAQAGMAISEADVIILVVDAAAGLTPYDREIALRLRRTDKPVLVAANKIDGPSMENAAAEFHALALGVPIPLSARNGYGFDEFLEAVLAAVPRQAEPAGETLLPEVPRVSVVGRPNVGKSSLLNALLGQDRFVTSPLPGTTRDAVSEEAVLDGRTYLFVDTAGVRRRGRIERGIEKFSIVQTMRAIEESDVVLLLVDVSEGLTEQDLNLAGAVAEAGRGVMVLLNKWDLLPKEKREDPRFLEPIRYRLRFLSYAPLRTISATRRHGLRQIPAEILKVMNSYSQRVPTPKLNRVILAAAERHPPPRSARGAVKIKYVVQTRVRPPSFALFTNRPGEVPVSYRRFLEHALREAFGFEGTPLRLTFRASQREKPGRKTSSRGRRPHPAPGETAEKSAPVIPSGGGKERRR